MNKAPRSDSKLKLLPKETQQQIITWRETLGHAGTLKMIEKELGLKVGAATLTEFYGWYYMMKDIAEYATFADQAREELAQIPGLAQKGADLDAAAGAIFRLRAAKANDSEVYARIRTLEQNDRMLDLKARQVSVQEHTFMRKSIELFIKWAADKKALEIATGDAGTETKVEELGQQIFGEEWQ